MTTRPWTVNRPGPLTPVAPDVWTIDDVVPGPRSIPRKMTVLRRSDGELLFFNAIPVPEETLSQLRGLGTPKHLIVPNQFHALDPAPFAHKLALTTWAHPTAIAALGERLVQPRPIDAFPHDADSKHFTVSGFRTHETVFVFRRTLLAADLVTNLDHQRGFMGFVMKLVGFTGPELKLPRPVRKRVEVDTEAVRTLLRGLAELPLDHIIPSHGATLTTDTNAALRRVADGL